MKIKTISTIPFAGTISFDEFQKHIQVLDFTSALMLLQKVSSFLGNQSSVNINLEFEFHGSPRVKHRILLTRDFISFFAKQIILNCSKSTHKCNELDLTNLAFQYGNMEIDLSHITSASKDSWLWVLRAKNHQLHYLRPPVSIIGRYVHLFKEVFNACPKLKVEIDKNLKLEFFELLKMGTWIFMYFFPKQEGFATFFSVKSFTNATNEELKTLFTEDNINKFLSIFSLNKAEFRKVSAKYSISNSLLKKYEFNLLKRFPIIKTDSEKEEEKFIFPSLADFLYACFEGMYYVLLDNLQPADKDILLQQFGTAFETYIGVLINHYNLPLFSRADLLPEQIYKDGTEVKSADWLLISDEYIFQIECKKRKLDNYSKAGVAGENKTGIISFLASIAKELDKLNKKEAHIREGKVEKVKYNRQEFVNIIVYLDEMFAINDFARNEIKSKMAAQANNFYILGCYEFELLCQYANQKNLNLKAALDDLVKKRTEIYSIEFLDNIYSDFMDTMMKFTIRQPNLPL